MPLMTAISKMTYLPAKFLQDNGVSQMAQKGRIQVGADADITIFDPKIGERQLDDQTRRPAGHGHPLRDRERHRRGEGLEGLEGRVSRKTHQSAPPVNILQDNPLCLGGR